MNTLEQVRQVQNEWRERVQQSRLERYTWISETVTAYRNLTPEQLADLEALMVKRGRK
jgi:ClpP class serine protease